VARYEHIVRFPDLPRLPAAICLVVLGGWLAWWGLTQLGAGGNDLGSVGLYLVALVGGIVILVSGVLGLSRYVTRRPRR